MLAISINKIAEMLHRSLFDYNRDNKELYDVRTKKILMYSNALASTINLSYVAITNDMKRLDIGGLLVTLWRLINDRDKIKEIKVKFVTELLHNHYDDELRKSKKELEELGIYLPF